MYVRGYAKINIALDVIRKREDGYNDLRMIMQTIDLYDDIEVTPIEKGIKIACNKPFVPLDETNIAWKAAKLFQEKYNIETGVNINIKKNIPVAAGMAGGSTDAAAVLKAMRSLFKPELTDEELMNLGVKLGADVPYCIVGGTALCEGIGEKITKLKPFRNKILVVVKPNFGVSTKEVYQSLDLSKIDEHVKVKELQEAMAKSDLTYVCNNMKNLLESVTVSKHKIITSIKKDMVRMGSKGAMMSGSGPTVFGFFTDMLKAQKAFEELKTKYKETYITRTI